jgi:Zn-dependent protease with chaperone function
MKVDLPARARPPRLNPFAFPSDTTFRFVLLIVAVLGASLFIYNNLFFRFNGAEYRRTFEQCQSASAAAAEIADSSDPLASVAEGTALGECMAPFNRWGAVWRLGGVALLLGVAGALYWILPAWHIRRARFMPLTAEDAPEVVAYLADLCREAGLSRPPLFLWNPLNTTSSGLAFGRLGQYYIALTGGMVTQFYSDKPAFRAVVLHELAHLRNADVDKTYFTITVWWAFVAVALVPEAVSLIGVDMLDTFNEGWRILALAALVYLTRNAVLRARELYADIRASVWDGPTGALGRILDMLPHPSSVRWRAALRVHPDPVERRQALDIPGRLFRLGFWSVVGTGIGATIAFSNVQALVWDLTRAAELSFLGAGLIFAPLVAGVIGFGEWRATFAALMQGETTRGAGRAGLGLGLGAVLGRILSLDQSSTETFNDLRATGDRTTQFGLEALWSLVALISLFVFLRWIAACASTWLEVVITRRLPRLVAIGSAIVAGGVLALWLGLLFATHDNFLLILGLEGAIIALLAGSTIYLLLQPLVLLALVCLWAFPLSAWFWHGQPATANVANWAFLDPVPQQVVWLRQAPLRPRVALLSGLIGGAIYCGLVLALRLWWRWGMPEAVRSADEAKILLFYGQVALAALLQMDVAIVVAGWVQRLGALHGLFAAFVGGCLMTIAMLGLNLAFGGTVDLAFAWQTFVSVVNGGALLALPTGLAVAALAGWLRSASGGRRGGDVVLLHELSAAAPSIVTGGVETTERSVPSGTQ